MDDLNPKDNPIKIKCHGAATIPLDSVLEFQGNLKKLSEENRNKLIRGILSQGFISPIFVWSHEDNNFILDGHQRVSALQYMADQGWEIPDLPIVFVEAESQEDARRKLLYISSQYGEFETQELNNWLDGFDDELNKSLRLVDTAIISEIENDNIDLESFFGEATEEKGLKEKICPHCGGAL